jgi:signal transduction histidine kinase
MMGATPVSTNSSRTAGEPQLEEKVKPFRLVKYFTVTSLMVIFIGTIVLSVFNTHLARTMLQTKSQDFGRLLIENLNHQVFIQFVLPVALQYGKIQLRNKEQFDRMDKVVRNTLHSFNVDNVNIYDMDQTVSYSFTKQLVGQKMMVDAGYHEAIQGRLTTKVVPKGGWAEILLGMPRESRVITFAPLRAEKPLSREAGPILGVVEIEQDISEDYRSIFRFQMFIMLTCTVVMGALLMVLVLVVRRGEAIIENRAEERLRLKEKLNRAEHLSSLGEMMAGVSHEIRNPLGIIRSSAELLKKKMADVDPKNHFPDIIVQESNRLNNIITDFLNFARPAVPHRDLCQLEEIIGKNINYLSPQTEEQHYGIITNFNKKPPAVIADGAMLYQAFLNILINAMQAMPAGGPIWIRTGLDNGYATVVFEDQGPGIPEALIGKIWDPFFTTKEKGTGLGLGIVKNIILSHGGKIRIENRTEGGARVTVHLPLAGDRA